MNYFTDEQMRYIVGAIVFIMIGYFAYIQIKKYKK